MGETSTVSVGGDGVMLVNTGPADMTDRIQETIAELVDRLSQPSTNNCFGMNCPGTPTGWTSPYTNAIISSPAPPRPLRYILNTSAAPHNVGGNAALAATGIGRGGRAAIIAHENVLIAMSSGEGEPWAMDREAWPTESFYSDILQDDCLLQRRGRHCLSRTRGQYRRRQHRVFQAFRGDQRRRYLFDGELPHGLISIGEAAFRA